MQFLELVEQVNNKQVYITCLQIGLHTCLQTSLQTSLQTGLQTGLQTYTSFTTSLVVLVNKNLDVFRVDWTTDSLQKFMFSVWFPDASLLQHEDFLKMMFRICICIFCIIHKSFFLFKQNEDGINSNYSEFHFPTHTYQNLCS